ncbi:right-handed parallel beta-helix repeat-containing protein [Sphingomonas sp. LY29]|uniref:right-handed parallel beta-helix repeat-containing protein n=1 Tax=Sphingomonas sp. LY29 TaxID=3095341 RepID=UPI002D7769B4|nr:right-handed parallel beta-helix repeat-containing protein [Sphingomonas sp. LY29]WRP25724.1 right-handed parallel beta-helix repeat-containing protein [Sphingomonas sp. LY29]
MYHNRRTFLTLAAAAAAVRPAIASAQSGPSFRPEDFGARGDGATNDSAAFAALAAAVNRAGGGTIIFAKGQTYLVGAQARGGGPYLLNPAPLLELRDLTRPLDIVGNGARMKCRPGLRYGAFLRTGAPNARNVPNFAVEEVATPYRAMIDIRGCRAPITLRDLELDGNDAGLILGGRFGDEGKQIPATGLFLFDNHATETISNLYSHHHGQDGIMIDGDDRRPMRSSFSRVRCTYNGRQGVSIIGGRGYDFADCDFSHTGRAAVRSSPAAGVDIEAEGTKIVRDLRFTRCTFAHNDGCGMLAEAGDGADASFADCRFIGSVTWSAWARKPGLSFTGCTFVGSVVSPYPDARNPARAAQFRDCLFTDVPIEPGGRVFVGGGPIVNMAESDNVLFDGCRFELQREGTLPWGWRATYRDYTMRQRSSAVGYPKGRYLGTSSIVGSVDLYGSKVEGVLTVNGKPFARGLHGGKPW